uniref:Carbohydrate-binding family 9-like protein n=1 Tax=Prevotella sp. GTC17254 TaxID=3236794 RepID=A0AB33J0L1_9BACT
MTDKLFIEKLSGTDIPVTSIPKLFEENGIKYERLTHSNWFEQFPYEPKVEFAIAHSSQYIFIHYKVKEESIRAQALTDNGHVWEDSCCEFFISPDGQTYYNFECNCIGTLLIGFGPGREARTLASEDITSTVERWSSLEHNAIDNTEIGVYTWELALKIPTTALFKHDIKSFDGLTMQGNVYKCGDKLPHPHFVSLFPIALPKPDFHCPAFFKEIQCRDNAL